LRRFATTRRFQRAVGELGVRQRNMTPLFNYTVLNQSGGMPGWLLPIIIIGLIVWLWSVVHIAKTKTEDPYDRIVWLLIVLMLNFLGTLLYIFFGKTSEDWRDYDPKRYSEEEIKRRANEGTL
jgi:hypothetical protein